MKQIIAGYGEIGRAVYEIITGGTRIHSHDIHIKDPKHSNESTPIPPIDILHICFPYSDNFVHEVERYREQFSPKHIIIYSTVPIGTTALIRNAVHSPVEGKHPDLALSMRYFPRWIGTPYQEEWQFFNEYFIQLGLKTKRVTDSDYTEFLKLRSTSKYGINLVWADYEASVAEELGMDFELVKEFDKDYNKLYHELGMDWAQRYIVDPPGGIIGGHCVTQNAHLLNDQYPTDLLDKIILKEKS